MAVTKLDEGRIVLSNAEYVHITPYTDEDTIGNVTYDVVNIVGDTLSFTPDDNTVNSKESEFKDDPLFENVILGKYQFAATCIDFQSAVMEAIFGWAKDSAGNVFAPTGYNDKYAVIEIGFRNENVVVVAPKVKMNSKATIGTLKTGTGEGALAGTAYSESLTPKAGGARNTPIAFLVAKSEEVANTYTIKGKSFTCGEGVGA